MAGNTFAHVGLIRWVIISGFFWGIWTARTSAQVISSVPDSVMISWQDSGYIHLLLSGKPPNWTILKGVRISSEQLIMDSVFRYWYEKSERNAKGTYWISAEYIYKDAQIVLNNLANHGYPAAELSIVKSPLDSLSWKWQLRPGPMYFFDSIQQAGVPTLAVSFLYQLAGIRPGEVFSAKKVSELHQKLKSLGFVKVEREPMITFLKEKALVMLFLTDNRNNQADGVIGIAPQSDVNPGKMTLTGEFNLRLENMFRKGVFVSGRFNGFRGNSQSLALDTRIPYLPGFSIGWQGKADFTRLDSTLIEVKGSTGPFWMGTKNSQWSGMVTWQQSAMLRIDSAWVLSNKILPANHGSKQLGYGLGFYFQNLNSSQTPTKGWDAQFSFVWGRRVIERNRWIESALTFDSAGIKKSIYDQIQLTNRSFRTQWRFRYFYPFKKMGVFFHEMEGGLNWMPSYFVSDYFRIGGLKTLRGFDEQWIFTPGWQVFKQEVRLYYEEKSFVFIFGDVGLMAGAQVQSKWRQTWAGGFGVTLKTKAGLLTLIYAQGAFWDSSAEWQKGKVHIGFSNW